MFSTRANNIWESLIYGNFKPIFFECFFQASGYSDLAGIEHEARIRRPPQNGLSFDIPWKNAPTVGQQESIPAQVPTDGEQPVGVGELGRRKNDVFPPLNLRQPKQPVADLRRTDRDARRHRCLFEGRQPGGFVFPATAGPSGVVQLVAASKVYTSLTGAFPEVPLTAVLSLHFVPEPGTLLLVSGGLVGLVAARRKQGK